jgi:hypothetical protein
VTDREEARLDRRFERLEKEVPEPSSRWVRIPLGALLILSGIFSFLPILGLWMLPLGLLLLAQDIPFLRAPTGRALIWLERKWVQWKRRRSSERQSRKD